MSIPEGTTIIPGNSVIPSENILPPPAASTGGTAPTPTPAPPPAPSADLATVLAQLAEEKGRRAGTDKALTEAQKKVGDLEAQIKSMAEVQDKLKAVFAPNAPEGEVVDPIAAVTTTISQLQARLDAADAAAQKSALEARKVQLLSTEAPQLLQFSEDIRTVADEAGQKAAIVAFKTKFEKLGITGTPPTPPASSPPGGAGSAPDNVGLQAAFTKFLNAAGRNDAEAAKIRTEYYELLQQNDILNSTLK